MSVPHKCPVCQGSGKKHLVVGVSQPYQQGTAINPNYYTPCNACSGTGIVWGPSAPMFVPYIPYSPPTAPEIGLTFPQDFNFPPEIVEGSKEKLIGMLKDWIKKLEVAEAPEESNGTDK